MLLKSDLFAIKALKHMTKQATFYGPGAIKDETEPLRIYYNLIISVLLGRARVRHIIIDKD